MVYLLGLAICLALAISSVSLYRYGCVQRHHPLVSLSVLTAWTFSFLIVFTIPLDVTSTVYRQCVRDNLTDVVNNLFLNTTTNSSSKATPTPFLLDMPCQQPPGMVPEYVFPNLWRIIYWSSQFLTWLILPLMQSYLKAGEFTFKGKLKSAIIDNAIYYGSYLLICAVLLIYIALKPGVYLDWQKLKAIASSASNTWGLFLLVLLLGYALVEVPRGLWNSAKPGFLLQYAYFKLSKLSLEKSEAEENVEDILESLQAANRAIPNHHELRGPLETILRKVPAELLDRASRNIRNDNTSTIIPSEKAMVRLHKQVIKSLQTLQRSEALWGVQVERILYLEDVSRNCHAVERRFKAEFPRNRGKFEKLFYNPVIDWYWECLVKPQFLKSLAIITGLLSLIVVWSELTFFNRYPVLSIFANILNFAKDRYDFFTIEVVSMATLCYLCYCAYSTVFRIKFLNLYYLAAHHQTNEHSLIFSGMLLCRLTPPMCLNFLGMIHMDSHIIKQRTLETHYTQIMGHMDVLGIIADGFNIYFPMLMLAFCLATWFSLGSRALNVLGFQQFMLNETIASELVQEGKDLIVREKRKRQRAEEAMARRNNLGTRDRDMNTFHRSTTTAPVVGPGDGLLRLGDNSGYSTTDTRRTETMNRSLSEEISERFGTSTQPTIGFRTGATVYNDYLNDSDNEEEVARRNRSEAPRNLFDDV